MAMPANGSRTRPTRGSMTPPLPSPPISAPTSRIIPATLASPTAARWQGQPNPAAQGASGAAVAVEEGLEAGVADARAVHQPEDQVAVDLLGLAVVADVAQLVPRGPPAGAGLEQLLDLRAGGGGEHLPVGPEQL